jgi:SPP1 gp7 family putative phage head morphogenesis protein
LRHRVLAEMYKPCKHCGGVHLENIVNDAFFGETQKEAERIAGQIYKGTFKGNIDRKLTGLVYGKLSEALLLGIKYENFEPETIDKKLFENLKRNVYHFSAAKDYWQLRAMTNALKDNTGKLRNFNDYKTAVNQINKQFNEAWLKTEYNGAVAGAQMSTKWNGFEADAVLEYSTVNDGRVRDDHKALDGVKRKKSDKFWDKYYPPNGWNCRCTVIEQSRDTKETAESSIKYPDVPEMWQVNTGKMQMAFPPEHPYFVGLPEDVKKEIDLTYADIVRKKINRQKR